MCLGNLRWKTWDTSCTGWGEQPTLTHGHCPAASPGHIWCSHSFLPKGLAHWSVSVPECAHGCCSGCCPFYKDMPGLPGKHSPQGCLQLSWGITWPTASFCLVPVSPHLPDGIKELKQSHHSVSCHHDAQHLHRHTIRQKKIFSLISDFPSPKPSCISRLTHLTAHTSPLCCSALPKAMARLDPESQGWTALPELPLSFLLGWDWWWLRVREMLSLSNLYWKQVSDHCIWVLQSRSTFPTK